MCLVLCVTGYQVEVLLRWGDDEQVVDALGIGVLGNVSKIVILL